MSIMDCIKTENMTLQDGIYYANNIPDRADIALYDERMEGLDSLYDTSFWHNHRTACIIAATDATRKWSSDCVTGIIDVGGGSGNNVNAFEKAGYDAALFEPTLTGVICAKKRGVKNIVCGIFDETTIEQESVPIIGLFDVLEHIEKDDEFLRNMHPLLKDGGNIIATVPAHMWLWSEKDDGSDHHRRYTLQQLSELFKNNGYIVTYATYFFSLLMPVQYITRVLPYKLLRKKHKLSKSNSNKFEKEHNPFASNLLLKMLKPEQRCISKLKRIPFGSSVLLIAKKGTISNANFTT